MAAISLIYLVFQHVEITLVGCIKIKTSGKYYNEIVTKLSRHRQHIAIFTTANSNTAGSYDWCMEDKNCWKKEINISSVTCTNLRKQSAINIWYLCKNICKISAFLNKESTPAAKFFFTYFVFLEIRGKVQT